MIVEQDMRLEAQTAALEALAKASREVLEGGSLDEALAPIVEAAAAACAAEVVVVRVLDPASGYLVARAVAAASPAQAAELEGSRFPLAELVATESDDPDDLPTSVRRVVAGAGAVLQVPVLVGGRPLGSLEVLRVVEPFGAVEAAFARLAAAAVGIAVRELGPSRTDPSDSLQLAGEALTALADREDGAEQIARLASEAAGAQSCLLWRTVGEEGELVLAASCGVPEGTADIGLERERAAGALAARGPVVLQPEDRSPGSATAIVQLGQPPVGALQLFYDNATPSSPDLETLATFGVRAARALLRSEQAREQTAELERTRALLAVVGQAIAQLSLAHTLETVVDRVAELIGSDRVAVYLDEDRRLLAAAGRGLEGPHGVVAERLLELGLGPFRARGLVHVTDVVHDPRLVRVGGAAGEAGIEAAVAVPLLARDEVVGLLAVYPAAGYELSENESALLIALASQLAVAVQNARLHEQTKLLGEERERALDAERQAAQQLLALYEISRSFAQSLRLDTTVEAIVHTVVDLLDVDAAVLRMPDERGDRLEPGAVHVRDPRLADVVRMLLEHPQPLARLPGRRILRQGKPLVLDAPSVRAYGPPHELLAPFLEKGSTAVVVPISTPSEMLATLTLLSLDPARPIGAETIEIALSIAGQAALALDNARLYQQQKHFSDTMQRSLLPRSLPAVPGLELGDVYASSARVDVGGDVYDYLTLEDGRLAVVLGDVTGHGIDATADMAMAKFVFRSLAREHPEPAEFLAHANDVVVGEIAPGKFITMVYLTVDPERGEVAGAGAGHPEPRVLRADGTVDALPARGLALGIDPGQEYEEVRRPLEPGAAVVLYTDGVVEARRGGELYGTERLDALLAERRDLSAAELARAVLADCRAFSGGELQDDCAAVVIRRGAG